MLPPGTVIYLEVRFRRGPRNKYLVVVEWASDVHCLIVNSEINPYYGHGAFKDYYVLIDQKTHPFLKKDSYVDCNEVRKLIVADVEHDIQMDQDCVKGVISDGLRERIIEAVSGTPCLSPYEKQRYAEALQK